MLGAIPGDEGGDHWGELSFGPIPDADLDRLDALLDASGLRWPNAHTDDVARVVQTLGGSMIEIAGESVLGYLVSTHDALEAERSQLRQLGLHLLRPGQTVMIDGMHFVGVQRLVRYQTTIRKTGPKLGDVKVDRAFSGAHLAPSR